MNILKDNIKMFAILFVVILGFIIYAMSDHAPSPSTIERQSAGMSKTEQEILQLLADVQSIKLNSTIFQDPAFASLRDMSRSIIEEEIGHPNPFYNDIETPEFASTTKITLPTNTIQ